MAYGLQVYKEWMMSRVVEVRTCGFATTYTYREHRNKRQVLKLTNRKQAIVREDAFQLQLHRSFPFNVPSSVYI